MDIFESVLISTMKLAQRPPTNKLRQWLVCTCLDYRSNLRHEQLRRKIICKRKTKILFQEKKGEVT